jgi:hypothetical protein
LSPWFAQADDHGGVVDESYEQRRVEIISLSGQARPLGIESSGVHFRRLKRIDDATPERLEAAHLSCKSVAHPTHRLDELRVLAATLYLLAQPGDKPIDRAI